MTYILHTYTLRVTFFDLLQLISSHGKLVHQHRALIKMNNNTRSLERSRAHTHSPSLVRSLPPSFPLSLSLSLALSRSLAHVCVRAHNAHTHQG